MITSLRLQNFKCFENQVLPFKPLTLLSGLNGTGKSSVIQSLLLLRQSFQQGLLENGRLALNGDLIHIGTAQDALFEGAKENKIGFDLSLSEVDYEPRWIFVYDQVADVLTRIPWQPDGAVAITEYHSSLFNENFHYLQAERLGPRRFFDTSNYLVSGQRQLGPAGEFTAHFLSVWGENIIPNSTLAHPSAISLTLRHQVEAWLGEISPGTQINLTPNAGTDTITLQFGFMIDKVRSNWYRSTNVGFGITYVLPILVAVLSSAPGSLLLIENPEAHLHPKGQAQMGDLLARAASGGVQVVVETHSDHVLNGIRVAVHDGKIRPDDVQLHYFQRRKEEGQSQVISPHIDQDGRIDTWPDGFFDEWDKNLEALLD